MAKVTLTIGGHRHIVGCRDGEEAQVRTLGEMLDARWPAALRASAGEGGERAMLFVALMLADALHDAERAPAAGADPAALAQLADRLEALAAALEEDDGNA